MDGLGADAGTEHAHTVELRHAWCQMCGPAKTFCSTLCRIEDGVWTAVEGNPLARNDFCCGAAGGKALCAKGNAAPQFLAGGDRLTHPLRRVGEKGEGRFERCTWDEALSDIACRLLRLKADCGPESLGILSPQAFPVLWTLGRRFLNVHGSPNYLHSAICFEQRAQSAKLVIGKAGCFPAEIDKTRLLVNWGANPENSGVNRSLIARRLDAQDSGMKVIDIRPMADSLTARADLWLPVRPGTDLALALAVLHVIIGEGLYDRDFVRDWCHGFDELAAHVRPFTPAWAQERTGVDAGLVVEAARLMGTVRPMAINYGNGIGDQQSDGNWACIAICLIEAITGNLDVPGGGRPLFPSIVPTVRLRPIDLLSERLPRSAEDRREGLAAGVSQLAAPEFPRPHQRPDTCPMGPTSAYFTGLLSALTDDPHRVRAIIAQSTNPLSATRQPKRTAEALRALDLFVVHDIHWNPSCDFADYVLPACTQYECSQQIGAKHFPDGSFVAINQKLAEPPGQACSDWEFYLRLACAMGYGADFWEGDMDACLREQLAGTGITLEQLRAAPEGVFVKRPSDASPPPKPAYRRYKELFADLPHGKVQCFNETLARMPRLDGGGMVGPLPEYAGPPEGVAETPGLLGEYPYVFSDVHASRWCNHGYYVNVPYLRERQPYPWVEMHPHTAREAGVSDGDWVRVTSPHGWMRLVARETASVPPGILMARRGWWQPCDELSLPGYGCFDGGGESAVLYASDPACFDPFHSAMPKQTLVRIEPLGESVDPRPAPRPAPRALRAKAATANAGKSGGTLGLAATDAAETADNAASCAAATPPATTRPAKERYSFDPTRCIGCAACAVACKQHNGIPAGTPARCVLRECAPEGAGVEVDETGGRAVAAACEDAAVGAGMPAVEIFAPHFAVSVCMRCDPPRCIQTCPTRALILVG